MRRVYAREEVCISCKLCEVGCAVEHSESKAMITAMRYESPSGSPESGSRSTVQCHSPSSAGTARTPSARSRA